MGSRPNLQEELEKILGNKNVYYQPPESKKMQYPAIVYSRADINVDYANDKNYRQYTKYNVTLLDVNPDSAIIDKLINFKYSKFQRHYTYNGLNHEVFVIYY